MYAELSIFRGSMLAAGTWFIPHMSVYVCVLCGVHVCGDPRTVCGSQREDLRPSGLVASAFTHGLNYPVALWLLFCSEHA